jgi:hypothetical protein
MLVTVCSNLTVLSLCWLQTKPLALSPFDINFSPLLSIECSLLLSRSFYKIETVAKNVVLLVKGERGITMAKYCLTVHSWFLNSGFKL